MVRWLDVAEIAASGAATEELKARIAGWRHPGSAGGHPRAGTIDLCSAPSRLDHAMPADRILAACRSGIAI